MFPGNVLVMAPGADSIDLAIDFLAISERYVLEMSTGKPGKRSLRTSIAVKSNVRTAHVISMIKVSTKIYCPVTFY